MAKPRIFVSSTFYDLKHIRSSLEVFIDSLGFEPILSEMGSIAYNPDKALDEACYRDAAAADIFVLIVGGRYGSLASKTDEIKHQEEQVSITRREFDSAHDAGIPVYILIESGVQAEFQTYNKNKDREVNYAHVDSVNVFKFIEHLLSKPSNNPVFSFERSTEIQEWLREQWSGLFRDLLSNRAQNQTLMQLSDQIRDLEQINKTLQSYMESIIGAISPESAKQVIESESERRATERRRAAIVNSEWGDFVLFERRTTGVQFTEDDLIQAMLAMKRKSDIKKYHINLLGEEIGERVANFVLEVPEAARDFNRMREQAGLSPISGLADEGLGEEEP